MRAPSTCNVKRCNNPAPPGQGKCETHHLEARRNADKRRPNAHQRGYDKHWQRTAKAYLASHPHCCVCNQPATDVDHIDGQGPSSPRGHDWSNLQAMCHSCHTRKTNTHDGGGWRRNG